MLKYDGLAAGKGVVIAQTMEEADAALKEMLLDDKFGEGRVVVEDYLEGPEFSLLCFVSGRRVWPMVLARRTTSGPTTATRVPIRAAWAPIRRCRSSPKRTSVYAVERIMRPMAEAMVAEGCPFEGVLYGGLMKTAHGIKVIEFNARFGDPETEVVLPRLKSDIVDIFCAVADGRDTQLEWDDRRRWASCWPRRAIPEAMRRASRSAGWTVSRVRSYHMGTKADGDRVLTAGGRVLFVVGRGATLAEAREAALRDVARIECDNLFHRTDIGHWALDNLKKEYNAKRKKYDHQWKRVVGPTEGRDGGGGEGFPAKYGRVPHLAVVLVGTIRRA